jgi:hypothetical protein
MTSVSQSAACDINVKPWPFPIFILFFTQLFKIVLDESSHYFCQLWYPQTQEAQKHNHPITIKEIQFLLSQFQWDMTNVTAEWFGEEQYCTPLYPVWSVTHSKVLSYWKWLWSSELWWPRQTLENDKIFGCLKNKFSETYKLNRVYCYWWSDMFHKRRVIFWQYIPKKHGRFGFRIDKLCDCLCWSYDMSGHFSCAWRIDHPPPFCAEVKERVELYIYSPSGPSEPVLGWHLPLLPYHLLG